MPSVDGHIDFLFLDSCHEDWFAEWYIEQVFPRVQGLVFLQDIAFVDELEPSSEARHVWSWAGRKGIMLTLVGAMEERLRSNGVRSGYAERRNLRSNAVIFRMPQSTRGNLPPLADPPSRRLDEAEALAQNGEFLQADALTTATVMSVMRETERVNRHRLLVKAGKIYQHIGEIHEAKRAFQRALGMTVQANTLERAKGLSELIELFAASRQWSLLIQACFLAGCTPQARMMMLRRAGVLFRKIMKRLLLR